MAMLRAEAARFGWQPITDPTPGPVAEALRSDRCKIALGARHQGHQIWMIYHHWTESSGDDTARVHDLTRYFLVLGAGYPYIRLHRRQRIDERWLKSIIDGWLGLRDFHTGHAGFDTRFAFEAPATVEPRRLLTPPLVEAMVAGRLPLWEIDEGVLVTRHLGEPTIATLRRRADSIVHLAGMLPGRHA